MRFMRLDRLRTIFWATFALLAVAALAVACGDESEAGVDDDPDIRGTITNLSVVISVLTIGDDDSLGSILIEGEIAADTQFDAAYARIKEDTDIFRAVDGELVEATPEDLEKGQQVEAWFTGAVAESYPVQATASRIVILGEPD